MIDLVVKVLVVLGLVVMSLTFYAAYEVSNGKDIFDAKCRDAGGIPLRATYHYDKKRNRIEYTCLSVNAVLDVE